MLVTEPTCSVGDSLGTNEHEQEVLHTGVGVASLLEAAVPGHLEL